MGRLNLAEIQPGMIIGADVLDRNGRVLLKCGIEITDKHLTILKQWGVTDADIQGVSRVEVNAQAVEHLDQDLLTKIELQYEDVFRHVDRQHPFNEELFRLSVLRTVNRRMGEMVRDN
jgi:hypothetical protein